MGSKVLCSRILLLEGFEFYILRPSETSVTFHRTRTEQINDINLQATISNMKGKYTFESLVELAQSLYHDAKEANNEGPAPCFRNDPGAIASFYTYPIGAALS